MKRRDLDDDLDTVAADGEFLRVPMMICDGFAFDAANHQPGFVRVTDKAVRDARAAATASYRQMVRRACDSWRRPARDAEPDVAWRGPLAAGPEPDVATTELLLRRHRDDPNEPDREGDDDPRERMRRHLSGERIGELTAQLEQARVREHQRRSRELSEAWKSPAGNASPRNAAAIERQRKLTTAERGAP